MSNLFSHREVGELEIQVTDVALTDDAAVYRMKIGKLPAVFKHPATISFEVTDAGEGFMFPTRGKCIIDIPILPNIKINGELTVVRRGS